MEFNRFYRIIRDKYITYAAAVEDFELLEANQEAGEIKENSINNEPAEQEKEYNPFE